MRAKYRTVRSDENQNSKFAILLSDITYFMFSNVSSMEANACRLNLGLGHIFFMAQ